MRSGYRRQASNTYGIQNAYELLPSLVELAKTSDRLSGQLGGLERLLLMIEENTKPRDPPIYTNASSGGLVNKILAISGRARLFGFSGVNTNASAQFILGFDLERGSVPANGAVPDFVTKAPANDNFWMRWAPSWREQFQGLWLCNSSTAGSLTIGAADCTFDVNYIAR